MNISWVTGTVYGMLAIIFVLIVSVQLIYLVDRKIEISHMIDPYVSKLSTQGLLESEQKRMLEEELSKHVAQLDVSYVNEGGNFGEMAKMVVKGKIKYFKASGFLKLTGTFQDINESRNVVIRKVIYE